MGDMLVVWVLGVVRNPENDLVINGNVGEMVRWCS